MYRLYGAPGRASAAPEAVLEELGVAYEYVDVDLDDPVKVAEYRRLNPRGLVPTLIDGDRAIAESAAICVYLCDRHPEGGLAPPLGTLDRGTFYQWMFYLSNTLQSAYMQYIYPARYYTDVQGAPRLQADAGTRIAAMWRELDAALAPGPFLLGERMSACDIYLHMLSTWHREAIVPLVQFPNVHRALALVAARPGVKQMMARNANK